MNPESFLSNFRGSCQSKMGHPHEDVLLSCNEYLGCYSFIAVAVVC